MTSDLFAKAHGMTIQVARRHFAKGIYKGEALPVVQLPAHRGGKGGKVWALHLDGCSPKLRAMLCPPESTDLTPVKQPLKGVPEARYFDVTSDKRAILKPILEYPKNTAERAAAFNAVAAQLHKFGNDFQRFKVSTLRSWVTAFEKKGAAALVPQARSDKGKARVFVVKRWDDRVCLPDAVKAKIAAELHRTAAGMIVARDISDRKIIDACAAELMRLTVEAGAIISKAELIDACKLNSHWVKAFRQYRPVHQFRRDHKAWSDNHQARVQRELEALPMDVLYGDEHYIDVILAALKEPIRVHLIGWLDGSSHYLWATLVILELCLILGDAA